jgi:hypothetical protein
LNMTCKSVFMFNCFTYAKFFFSGGVDVHVFHLLESPLVHRKLLFFFLPHWRSDVSMLGTAGNPKPVAVVVSVVLAFNGFATGFRGTHRGKMVEWSKTSRSGRDLPWRRGFKPHSCHSFSFHLRQPPAHAHATTLNSRNNH